MRELLSGQHLIEETTFVENIKLLENLVCQKYTVLISKTAYAFETGLKINIEIY